MLHGQQGTAGDLDLLPHGGAHGSMNLQLLPVYFAKARFRRGYLFLRKDFLYVLAGFCSLDCRECLVPAGNRAGSHRFFPKGFGNCAFDAVPAQFATKDPYGRVGFVGGTVARLQD